MTYKSIFNAVSTNNFFKGGVMSRLAFSAGGRVFESAVIFFALIFASVGCYKAGGQTANDLVGFWVFMEGSSKGKDISFQSDGRGFGYNLVHGGCTVSETIITDAAGNVAMDLSSVGGRQGSECAKEFAYEKVGDVVFLKSTDGKPLRIDYILFGGSTATYDEKWKFEILENGKYLKLNGILLKKVDDADMYAEMAKRADAQKKKDAFDKAIRAGKNAFKKNNIDGVISNYTEAIRLIPESVDEDIYFDRGIAYFMKDDYDRTIADFTQVIRLNPNNAGAYYLRGGAWDKKEDYDKSIADLSESLRLNPNNVAAKEAIAGVYNNRGWWLATIKKDYDRAIADCNKAIELNPRFANAYDSRGFAYAGKKDYNRAIADFTMALRINPNLEASYLERGNAYNEKREYKKAIADFNKVLKISKNSEKIGKAKEGLERAQRDSGKK